MCAAPINQECEILDIVAVFSRQLDMLGPMLPVSRQLRSANGHRACLQVAQAMRWLRRVCDESGVRSVRKHSKQATESGAATSPVRRRSGGW